jgi:hypothetical protein
VQTLKEKQEAVMLARIRKDAAIWRKAETMRQKRFDFRWRKPMQHPKWRKAVFAEIERKVATEWYLHGQTPEYARQNLLSDVYDENLPT